jgi:hypothetical protein
MRRKMTTDEAAALKQETTRKWHAENPERVKELSLRWRTKNKELARERARQWHKDNPERSRENARRYQEKIRALKLEAKGEQQQTP